MKLGPLGDETATLCYGEKFAGAADHVITVASHAFAEKGVGAIFDQREAMLVREGAKGRAIERKTEQMRCQDRLDARTCLCGEIIEIDLQLAIKLVEHRRRADRDDRVDHDRAVIGGRQNLVARPDAEQAQSESDRIASGGDFHHIAVIQDRGRASRPRQQTPERRDREHRLDRLGDDPFTACRVPRGLGVGRAEPAAAARRKQRRLAAF